MSAHFTQDEIIAFALQLPEGERLRIADALWDSVVDESVDHGPEEPADKVEAAWSEEIARRIDDIDSGRVKTIPWEEAERIIRGDVPPTV